MRSVRLSGRGPLKRVAVGAALSVAASCAVAAPVWAGEVTNNGDDVFTNGTLRHEIFNATDGEVITFQGSVDPLVTPGDILIDDSLTLRGNGMDVNTITGVHGLSGDRIFEIAPAHTVAIEDLTIAGGDAPDGTTPAGISQDGGDGEDGGAILFTAGLLKVDSVHFAGNNAGDGSDGSDGFDNNAGDGTEGGGGGAGGEGGAIFVGGIGQLNVTDSVFGANTAGDGGDGAEGGDGGGISGDGGFGGSGGFGGFGGAIKDSSSGTVAVVNSTFTNNRAGFAGAGDSGGEGSPDGTPGRGGDGGRGGAIEGSVYSVLNSTFSGNLAGNGGKGGLSNVTGGSGGGGGFGGGISASQGLTATNSTFRLNASGPGGEAGAPGSGAGGDGGIGGGIHAFGPDTVLTNLTIALNKAGAAGGGAPGGSPGTGAGVRGSGGVTLRNWLISNNVNLAGSQTTANCDGTFSFGTFGISFPADTGCPGSVGDPMLGLLQDNGGPTPTMALGAGSPAIDRIPPAGFDCPATDQRGITRPQGSACELGAFEVVAPPAEATAPPPQNATPPSTAKDCRKGFKLKKVKGKKKKRCVKKKKRGNR